MKKIKNDFSKMMGRLTDSEREPIEEPIDYVETLGRIYHYYTGQCRISFSDMVNHIKANGRELVSARDLAYLAVDKGRDKQYENCINAYISYGGLARETCIYIPRSKNLRILTREFLLEDKAHLVGEPFGGVKLLYLKSFNIGEYLEKTNKNDYFILENLKPVPTNRFKDDALTSFLFRDMSAKYGSFLAENGIPNFFIATHTDKQVNMKPWPFAFQSDFYFENDKKRLYLHLSHLDFGQWGNGYAIKRDNPKTEMRR